MWIDYTQQIQESVSQLEALERQHRGRPTADRIQMLRLLKSGTFRSRRELVPILGYCERQLQRWWASYSDGGLAALLEYQRHTGSQERITAPAWIALNEELGAGRITRLKDAQAYLQTQWNLRYSIGGLSRLFQRHKIKLKTGRRRHRRADPHQQEIFKKTSPSR
jgi:transposase